MNFKCPTAVNATRDRNCGCVARNDVKPERIYQEMDVGDEAVQLQLLGLVDLDPKANTEQNARLGKI